MSTSSHDYLARNPTDMDRHDTQPYSNYIDRLGNKLQLLTSDLRAEKNSRTNMEKRVLDTEHRIHGMLAQLNRMDQDTITNNQFLAQRLTGMEQTFDSHLAKEINNLADHTSNAWVSFDEQDAENTARLTSSMGDVEEDVQVLSSQLDALTSHIKDMEVNLKIKNEGPEEDLINNIIIRLTRLEDNQSKLTRDSNLSAYPPRTHDKVARSSPSVGSASGTHEGKTSPDYPDATTQITPECDNGHHTSKLEDNLEEAGDTQRSPRDSPEYDIFEDARTNEECSSYLQSDEVAEILSMGPTAAKGEDPTIKIVSSSNHCPLRDSFTNPGSS